MTSLRSHIADVFYFGTYGTNDRPTNRPAGNWSEQHADALLADPTLAAIYDLAAWWALDDRAAAPELSPEVRALLAAWRASRAEQEPER